MIITNECKINDYIHLVDLRRFGIERNLCCYVGEFDDSTIILDCGSSSDVRKLIKYLKINNVPFDSIKYIVISHYHFDHIGGIQKLYEEIKKYNPNVKVICSSLTKELIKNLITNLTQHR